MQIRIEHSTVYTYEEPVRYAVQELRLTPLDTRCQKVVEWRIDAPGIESAGTWDDAYGNRVHLTNQTGERSELAIRVTGLVETVNADGIVGQLPNEPPPGIFARATPLTEPDRAVDALASTIRGKYRDQIALYHALMGAIGERLEFDPGHTDSTTTAAAALKAGHGVCQDFAHVFLAVCRRLDQPARYVTGYLAMKDGGLDSQAHHAWVEAEVAGLGWVGFDPANSICPDENYVRLACGLDASSAAPIRGIRRGVGRDSIEVRVSLQVQFQQ
jgi:transglutaminase-like putative cysteine protease